MSDLASAAASGDRLTALQALRDRLATEIDVTVSARDVAALSARLVDVLAQIDDVAPPEEKKDDLAALVVIPGGRAG